MDQKAFGAFIAELRRAKKLTQRQVADKLHVTDRAVSKWERGLSYPDVTLLEPLADALGIGVGELLTCRQREPDGAEPEMPALQSVLTITQEEKRLRTRRTRIIAIAAAATAAVLAVLTTMQHNGALLYRAAYHCAQRQHHIDRVPGSAFRRSVPDHIRPASIYRGHPVRSLWSATGSVAAPASAG